MSSVLKRVEIPIALAIIATLLQVIPYYIDIKPLNDAANDVSLWVVILISWATFVGIISLMQVHGKNLQQRSKGWYFSVIVIVSCAAMALTGLPIPEVGLGPKNETYLWLYNNGNIPLGQTMYAILAFFMTSGAYRAFRAKNVEAGLVLLAGIIVICFNAPAINASWTGFSAMREWLFTIPSMATNRAVIIGTALGAIALALRTLLGIERGFLKGGSD